MVADPGADVRIYALTSGFTGLCVGYFSSVQVPPASRRPGAARPRLARQYATTRPSPGSGTVTSHRPDGVCTTGTGIFPSRAHSHAVW